MDIYEIIKSHTSKRKYKTQEVKERDLEKILEAARLAPSSINGQQWSVIVVKDKEKKREFVQLTGGQKWIEDAPVFLVFVADYYRTAIALEKEKKEFKNMESIESTIVSSVDVGLAFSNAMNVAESMGYGIVPIGAIRNDPEKVIELLKLPEKVYPILGMCIGVPDEDPMKKPRFQREAMIHEEVYNRDLKSEVDKYDETIENYIKERTNGKDVKNWSKGVSKTYSIVYSPKVYDSLKKQGFKNEK